MSTSLRQASALDRQKTGAWVVEVGAADLGIGCERGSASLANHGIAKRALNVI
jgi:hypothetical protein